MRVEVSNAKNCHEIESILAELSLVDEHLGSFLTADNMNTRKDLPNYIYVYDKQELVGCANLFSPNLDEVEIQVIVHPDADKENVIEGIIKTFYEFPIDKRIFVMNHWDQLGSHWMTEHGFPHVHSEVMLEKQVRITHERLSMEPLQQSNITQFNDVFSSIFQLDEGLPYEKWQSYLTNDEIGFYLFRDETSIVGICGCNFTLDGLMIFGFGVMPNCRKEGYGQEILASMEHLAVDRGMTKIVLEVDAANTVARRFYQHYGMREKQVYDYYLGMPL